MSDDNPNKAMTDHCKGAVKHRTLQTAGGAQKMRVLTEGDMYRLMTHSKLESAERFESLVFDEILPTIRKKRNPSADVCAAVETGFEADRVTTLIFRNYDFNLSIGLIDGHQFILADVFGDAGCDCSLEIVPALCVAWRRL